VVKELQTGSLVDLHRHLEGSIRPATSIEFAARIGTGVLPAQWRSALVAAEREEGLLPYLASCGRSMTGAGSR
jgi:adenosine deaminase